MPFSTPKLHIPTKMFRCCHHGLPGLSVQRCHVAQHVRGRGSGWLLMTWNDFTGWVTSGPGIKPSHTASNHSPSVRGVRSVTHLGQSKTRIKTRRCRCASLTWLLRTPTGRVFYGIPYPCMLISLGDLEGRLKSIHDEKEINSSHIHGICNY